MQASAIRSIDRLLTHTHTQCVYAATAFDHFHAIPIRNRFSKSVCKWFGSSVIFLNPSLAVITDRRWFCFLFHSGGFSIPNSCCIPFSIHTGSFSALGLRMMFYLHSHNFGIRSLLAIRTCCMMWYVQAVAVCCDCWFIHPLAALQWCQSFMQHMREQMNTQCKTIASPTTLYLFAFVIFVACQSECSIHTKYDTHLIKMGSGLISIQNGSLMIIIFLDRKQRSYPTKFYQSISKYFL